MSAEEPKLEDAQMAAYMEQHFGIRTESSADAPLPAVTEDDRAVDRYVRHHFGRPD